MSDPNQTPPPRKYAGADWLESSYGKRLGPISPLGREVADLLGDLEFGLYHVDEASIVGAGWRNELFVSIKLRDSRWATFDFDDLTRLVFLCHDRCIRCELSTHARGWTRLIFHKRSREGGVSQRHPTIEQALAAHREAYP